MPQLMKLTHKNPMDDVLLTSEKRAGVVSQWDTRINSVMARLAEFKSNPQSFLADAIEEDIIGRPEWRTAFRQDIRKGSFGNPQLRPESQAFLGNMTNMGLAALTTTPTQALGAMTAPEKSAEALVGRAQRRMDVAQQNATIMQEMDNVVAASKMFTEYQTMPAHPRAPRAAMERQIALTLGKGVPSGFHPENLGESVFLGHGPPPDKTNALRALLLGAGN